MIAQEETAQEVAVAEAAASADSRDPEGTYADFAAALNPTRGNRSGRTSIVPINQAPFLLGELPGYFLSLSVDRLATCWVACLIDAAYLGDFTPGDVARCLIVVAERLHGVKVEIQQGEPVMVQAEQLRQSVGPARAAPLNGPTPAAPPPAQRPAGKYTVFSGPPPAAKRKHTRSNEAMDQALTLQPGGWFIYEDAKKTFNCKKAAADWGKMAGFQLIIYRSTGGRVVVQRPGAEGVKLEQRGG